MSTPILRTCSGCCAPAASGHATAAPLSALGHKRTCAAQNGMSALDPIATRKADMPQMIMSALPPKADMCSALAHVCFGPKADIRPHSIDQFISAAEQRLRHDEAERLGGREVDYKLILGRRLHWQVGRLLALEDAIDIAGCASELFDQIRPIRDEAAVGHRVALEIDRG